MISYRRNPRLPGKPLETKWRGNNRKEPMASVRRHPAHPVTATRSLGMSTGGAPDAELRRALEVAAILVTTDRHGVITDCNEKFVAVSGYSREELIGSTHRIVNSGLHSKAFFQDLYHTIRSGKVWTGTLRNRRKDGSLYWVDTTIVPALSGPEGPTSYTAIRFEVTEHVLALEALSEARLVAERAAALRDTFLATMSHEVRTPLNGVLGLAQSLSGAELPDDARQKVDLIIKSGETLRRILDDVLDLSKIQAGEMNLVNEPFAPSDTISGAVDLMRPLASEKGLQLISRFDGLPPHLMGDGARLRQIVLNLVSNAIKFTAVGQVLVDARYSKPSRRLRIRVADTGMGFDRSTARQLFSPFSQADDSISRRFGGTGLGLSISRRLAELMSGGLRVRSKPGRGTLFILDLPMDPSSAITRESESHVEALDRLYGARILLAEDNLVNQQVVQALLSGFGCQIDVAENGQEAIDLWSAHAYDLIMMDMQMPVMDGVEAIRSIRRGEQQREINRLPIAMLTANASSNHRDLASRAGADVVIPKPLSADHLIFESARLLNNAARCHWI
ncbi:ATP-binding protein [uncultured Brevundimonas sp.]|uniref:PAS domain-containing hybrid sensor histidine kinase/response regulator n=1 Tax=uncultured Brevundimonas sp. TaxID=213418 RepID=UPI00345C2D4F